MSDGRGGFLGGCGPSSGGDIGASTRGGCSGCVTSMVTSTGSGIGGSLGNYGPASGGGIAHLPEVNVLVVPHLRSHLPEADKEADLPKAKEAHLETVE